MPKLVPRPVKRAAAAKTVESLAHDEAKRRNIPTAEFEAVMHRAAQVPAKVRYPRNTDLDPQLVWRGKDEQDWSDLVVQAPPLYIQEKVHPKALINELLRESKEREVETGNAIGDLFADFNGLPKGVDKTEFYQHDQNWSNRMILGDSLQVMASLAEREGLRGKVQCIYLDPPYGIKFNSNFQWSTTSRDVKDGNLEHITREPEQVKAFRDTWRDGIHSYLTYLRDRLTVARDLLHETGSIFVQIGDENVHRIRALMDEVFGEDNHVSTITYRVTANLVAGRLGRDSDHLLWYARAQDRMKYRQLYRLRTLDDDIGGRYSRVQMPNGQRLPVANAGLTLKQLQDEGAQIYRHDNLTSQGATPSGTVDFEHDRRMFRPGQARHWTTTLDGLLRLAHANRLGYPTPNSLAYVRFFDDFPVVENTSVWRDTQTGAFTDTKIYVVQTNTKVIERCLLMASDPGDLVLDPTCGSGTAAYIAEQWGRRWITVDTSRVALALARARVMGARYPFYLLADSRDGQMKEAELTRTAPSSAPAHGNIRHGFVYERVPHITLKSIANNAEIDVIWEKWQATQEPLRASLNKALKQKWEEWEIPRDSENSWPAAVKKLHAEWWAGRIARQVQIDGSIAAKAEFEKLYDKPYVDNKKVRVAGPFTVESLSPHRVLGVDENDELIDPARPRERDSDDRAGFVRLILENLVTAGVQQRDKEDRIAFESLEPWGGYYVCAAGTYLEGSKTKRAAVFIGPEFGTVSRADLAAAAREAGEAGFDVLIACAFAYEAHTTEFEKMGKLHVLKARMNADLHMAKDLRNNGKGNLFVIFGEPDIAVDTLKDGKLQVTVNGVDVFDPSTGKVRSDGIEGIACWFIDTDYNEESFFVRHAYFLGANDPYGALKRTLKAEIDQEAWESLHSNVSRPFGQPKSGRIAVKVINHLGDEVMKVFRVR